MLTKPQTTKDQSNPPLYARKYKKGMEYIYPEDRVFIVSNTCVTFGARTECSRRIQATTQAGVSMPRQHCHKV